jgi:hypothetical protein
VFENRVLRRIFVTRRDEVTGERKKLHNEELNDLYCLPDIWMIRSRKNEMGGARGTYGRQERYVQGFGRET